MLRFLFTFAGGVVFCNHQTWARNRFHDSLHHRELRIINLVLANEAFGQLLKLDHALAFQKFSTLFICLECNFFSE